jgi:hypothetical protein
MLTPSVQWRFMLEHQLGQHGKCMQIILPESLPECLEQIKACEPSVVIIEMNAINVAEQSVLLSQFYPQLKRAILLAVGDEKLKTWSNLLRTCGFVDICMGVEHAPSFVSRILCHLKVEDGECSRRLPPQSLESRIEEQLPWAPVAKLMSQQE